jgi:hypothetical protein
MYILPLIVILLIALTIFFSPIFALIIFILFLIGLGAYKFLGHGTEPEHAPASEAPAAGTPVTSGDEEAEGGMWGERWPEQRQGEEPS